jgi:hypothetical protein
MVLTLMLCHHKIFGDGIKAGKEMVRTGQDLVPSLFCPSWEHAFKGGYEMETCYSNARLSIYGMQDAPSSMIKGDMPAFMI